MAEPTRSAHLRSTAQGLSQRATPFNALRFANPMPLAFWESYFECEASLSARIFHFGKDLRLVVLSPRLTWARLATERQFRGRGFCQEPEQAVLAGRAGHAAQEQLGENRRQEPMHFGKG